MEPVPVSAGVGDVPMSPVIVVGPVFVIPEPASTAKLVAVPRSTGACAAPLGAVGRITAPPSAMTASGAMHATTRR